MNPTMDIREAYKLGVTNGRAAARQSRLAAADMPWHHLPANMKAYRRGYARGIREIETLRYRAARRG